MSRLTTVMAAGLLCLAPTVSADESATLEVTCAEHICLATGVRTSTADLVVRLSLSAIAKDPSVVVDGTAIAFERCDASLCVAADKLLAARALRIDGEDYAFIDPWNDRDRTHTTASSAAESELDYDPELPAGTDPGDDVVLVGGEASFHCSGVLIGPHQVLTARHCLPATRIGVGGDQATALVVEVVDEARHPELDVAVLTLAEDVDVQVRPRRRSTEPPAGVVRLVGYGVEDPRTMAGFGIRHRVDVPVDGWGCVKRRARKLGCHAGKELLVTDRRGNDTCYGDSGGAVLEAVEGGWQLLAITSRPTRIARRACGSGGIYVRVDVLAEWLDGLLLEGAAR